MKKLILIILGISCILGAVPAGYWIYFLTWSSYYGSIGPAIGVVAGGFLGFFGLVCLVKGLLIGSNNRHHTLSHTFLAFWVLASLTAFLITALRLILGRSHLSVEPVETYLVLGVVMVCNVLLWIWFRWFKK